MGWKTTFYWDLFSRFASHDGKKMLMHTKLCSRCLLLDYSWTLWIGTSKDVGHLINFCLILHRVELQNQGDISWSFGKCHVFWFSLDNSWWRNCDMSPLVGEDHDAKTDERSDFRLIRFSEIQCVWFLQFRQWEWLSFPGRACVQGLLHMHVWCWHYLASDNTQPSTSAPGSVVSHWSIRAKCLGQVLWLRQRWDA